MTRTDTIAHLRTQLVRLRPAIRQMIASEDRDTRERGCDIAAAVIVERAARG